VIWRMRRKRRNMMVIMMSKKWKYVECDSFTVSLLKTRAVVTNKRGTYCTYSPEQLHSTLRLSSPILFTLIYSLLSHPLLSSLILSFLILSHPLLSYLLTSSPVTGEVRRHPHHQQSAHRGNQRYEISTTTTYCRGHNQTLNCLISFE
jgi:hypothetical protein